MANRQSFRVLNAPHGKSDRSLIINADDFGLSDSINEAVARAHQQGVLSSASLMVNGDAFASAVEIARAHPNLGVGLHLTLLRGKATLPCDVIPGLTDEHGCFSSNPVKAGWSYFARNELLPQLEQEMEAQFQKFTDTGLELDHVNGHLHLHLHPTILSLLLKHARRWRIKGVRLTADSWRINRQLASGRWVYRLSHWLTFSMLVARARPRLQRAGIVHTDHVFGLLQNGAVDQEFIMALTRVLPVGVSELYCHPSLQESRHEYEALISPRVAEQIRVEGIRLTRYQDLHHD